MTDELSAPKLTKLAETIGFEITEFTPGKCIVELTIREDHLNAGGVAHGGLHATLLDTAMGGTLVTTLPKEEMRGDLDVYNIHHWTAIQGMFIRNQRREEIEKNMTHPSDAINTAIESFMELDHGSDDTTKQEELL